MTVADVDRSAAWYRDVLGLERLHQDVWGSYPAFVCAGGSGIALFPGTLEQAGGRTIRHVAFRVDRRNFEEARSALAAKGIQVTFQDHQIAHSIYFEDPDGNQLELTTYEV